MMRFLKNLLLASVVCSMGFSTVACSDSDETNERDTPKIFEDVVSVLWENAGCDNEKGEISCGKSQCKDVHDVIVKMGTEKDVLMKDACSEYNSSLERNKNNPEKLASDMDNSGFYLASYILLSGMQKEFYGCKADSLDQKKVKEEWLKLFNSKGCTSLLDDAEKVMKNRGK